MIKKVSLLNKNIKKNYYFILLIKKKKNINKNTILILLIITSIFFYILSLCHIQPLSMKCYKKEGVECFYILAKLTFVSSIILSIGIYLILLQNFKKL